MMGNWVSRLGTTVLILTLLASAHVNGAIVINELHTNPDVKTELLEFVELHNAGPEPMSLSGWSLAGGILYTFPAGTVLPAGGYLVVGQSPTDILGGRGVSRFHVAPSLVYGPYVGKLANEGDRVILRDAAGTTVDEVNYRLGFPWPTVGDPISDNQPGTGRSMQLIHPSLDNDLGGSWRSAAPTPAEQNSTVSLQNLPPHVRQVAHTPRQPRSGQVVTITAKVTDSDGVAFVKLLYQIVDPGNYIAIDMPSYANGWQTVDMHDDGLDDDLFAHDDIYTVQIPALRQKHRRLVRYRLFVVDGLGNNLTVPYSDDPQPNFAYFVYDGVPAWSGAIRPGSGGATGEVVEYSPEVLTSLPVYHLVANHQDVVDALYMPGAKAGQYGGSDYRWRGTIVYDGVVYDHIRFRARGGVWRYAMGKNMLKADFLRGHYFQARDDYGRPYDTQWDKLNFSACIQQGDYQHRGEQGMFEAAGFKLFNLMGCPASKTNWVHFRVIDDADEFGATQYDGDFWGLYMTIEQMDGRFLDEHGLPDGNLYKMDRGSGDAGPGGGALNNQGPTQPTDHSDLVAFVNGYHSRPQEPWWRQNVDLASYYGFRCTVEAIHHGDMEGGKNWFFYHDPTTERWTILPWDLDLTWANNMYGGGADEFTRNGIFSNANLRIEFQNRLREFFDLLYNADQGWQMLDELANVIDPPTGGPTFVDADRAMWDYNPIMTSSYVNPSKSGQGRFYQRASTKDFRGMVQIMKDYVVSNNRAFNTYVEDNAIPQTPLITATGPADFPANALTFRTSAFADPQGAGMFAALKWRIGEVALGSQVVQPDESSGFLFVPDGSQWKYFKGTAEPSATAGAWRTLQFNDAAWLVGRAPIGFGEAFLQTSLPDMRGNYSTIYLRKTFDATNVAAFDTLVLEAMYDDGINVWINNHLVFQDNVASDELAHDATAVSAIEVQDFVRYDVGVPSDFLVEGTNVIAVQVLNSDISSSSDCFIDLKLSAETTEEPDDETPAPVQVYRGEPGRYEIEALWESAELTQFNPDVRIPASAVKPGRTYRVRCRMKDNTGRWSHWSSPVQFTAGDPVAAGILADLRITELMYHPAAAADAMTDADEFEFIELKNIGDETLDLSSVSLTKGVTFDFVASNVTTLGPGRFVLVVKNRQAFLSRYGAALSSLIAGQYEGKLANGGETVALEDFWNGTIAEFTYGDSASWPVAADGAGHSMVPLASAILDEPAGSLDYAGNWRASAYIGGSPGADDPDLGATVVINEFLAAGGDDWVELYNPTNASVALADFYLSDDAGNLKKWPVAAPAIGSGDFLTFEESGDDFGFGLSRSGEDLLLSYLPGTAQDRVVDSVRFKAQESGISRGRYPDGDAFWFRLQPTRDVANAGAVLDLMVSEIMYHPVDVNDEFIELFNPTDAEVILESEAGPWRLDGGVHYTFDTGLSIASGGCVVVVGFDPFVETARLAAFIAAYGAESLTPGADIVGPWEGGLNNGAERIALEKPQATGDLQDPIAWVVVDEVVYADAAPWPATADGQGDSLQRIDVAPDVSSNDPAAWHAALPTPGTGL